MLLPVQIDKKNVTVLHAVLYLLCLTGESSLYGLTES